MTPTPLDSPKTHAQFKLDFIWAALALAVFLGFAIGAHLAFVIGLEFRLGDGFYSFIQIHGHTQLIGWAGLFIIGVSLHFIPRFAGTPINRPHYLSIILWLIVLGVLLRSIGHAFLPYLIKTKFFVPLLWIVASSGIMELAGVALYLFIIIKTLRRAGGIGNRPALLGMQPFFMMMLAGWLLYIVIHAALLFDMALKRFVIVDPAWNEFAVNIFSGLILLPVAMAFSIRTFPLYLRLPAPHWPVRTAALVYLIVLAVQLLPALPPLTNNFAELSLRLSSAGAILKSVFILWFIWKLDVLTRRRQPWTVNRILQPQADRRPTRPGLPDYGEFGAFERLLYSAYVWLALAAILEIFSGEAVIFGFSFVHGVDAPRHAVLLGFISLLIFGMAVRMIPGFLGRKRIASTRLVGATFWLGNAAAVCRVVPLILPVKLFEALPVLTPLSQAAFALSGILGMAAVGCLAVNLRKTVRLE